MHEARDLAAVDAALVRLRRLWTTSPSLTDDAGAPVEMSSVLMVEGCARLTTAGAEVTVGALSDFADVAQSTGSRLVDRAVAAGLLVRRPSAHDLRRTGLALTPAGQALRRRAVAFRLTWLQQTLADWDEEDVAALGEILTRFATAVQAGGSPGRPGPARVRRTGG